MFYPHPADLPPLNSVGGGRGGGGGGCELPLLWGMRWRSLGWLGTGEGGVGNFPEVVGVEQEEAGEPGDFPEVVDRTQRY